MAKRPQLQAGVGREVGTTSCCVKRIAFGFGFVGAHRRLPRKEWRACGMLTL